MTNRSLAELVGPALRDAGFALGLGRWASSGNRCDDVAAFAGAARSQLPRDAGWLSLRVGSPDPGVLAVGVEALAALLVADDDLRFGLAARLEDAAVRHAPSRAVPLSACTWHRREHPAVGGGAPPP